MEEEQNINTYELNLLITPELSDFDLNKLIDKVKALITSDQGKLIKEHSWGKKQLAYAIKKNDFGFYHTLIFELPTDKMIGITKELELSAKILRYLNLSLDKEGVTIDQLFTPEKEEAMISSSVKEKITPKKPVVKQEPKIKVEEVKTEVSPADETVEEPKIDEETRKKELDKKIDELLKTDEEEK